MRFVAFKDGEAVGLAVRGDDGRLRGRLEGDGNYPGDLLALLQGGPGALERGAERLRAGREIEEAAVTFLPPLPRPPKIVCVGLNYVDHSAESPFEHQDYPTLFPRYPVSLTGHRAPIVRPRVSGALDFEGELALVIGKAGRHVPKEHALSHVAGYALFNDATVRDYAVKSTQWTMGKNFDSTGAFGPELVTADELPPGGSGLRITTSLNGRIVQDANTDQMYFSAADLIATMSEVWPLEVGDVVALGTPAGVGIARKPPLFMNAGDVVEVEVERVGRLTNPVVAEA